MRRYLYLYIAFLTLISCGDKKKSIHFDKYNLQAVDSIQFKNPSYSYYMSWNNQYVNDTLVRLSYGTDNAIELIDLKNEKFIDVYQFKKGTDKGVGRMQGFYYHNRDSLFVFNNTQIVLTNLYNDSIINVYDIKGDYDKLWYPLNTANGNDITLINDKIYFGKTDFEKTNSNAYYDSALLMEIDLKTNTTIQYDKIHFPELYYDKCWQDRLVDYSMIFNPLTKEFIFNFPISHYTYVFNTSKNKFTTHFTRSKYMPDGVETMKCNTYDVKKRRSYLYSKTYYYKSIYDPYRKVYYRIVKHSVNQEKAIELSDNFYGDHTIPFSIMIIDKDFKVVGETNFPSNTYSTGDFFVGPKGLYIQKNNVFNENFDENIIKYEILLPKLNDL